MENTLGPFFKPKYSKGKRHIVREKQNKYHVIKSLICSKIHNHTFKGKTYKKPNTLIIKELGKMFVFLNKFLTTVRNLFLKKDFRVQN